MNLHALEIPELHDDVVPWLERHLVSLDLPDLVAELAAVYDAGRVPRGALDGILGGRRDEVLRHGLGRLTRDQFRRLLTEPFLLFELQELVLTEGGRHWRQLESVSEVRARVEDQWRTIKAKLPDRNPVAPPQPRPAGWAARPWPWVLVVAAAALGFAACYAWLRVVPTPAPTPPAAAAWGWNKPDALAPADSPQAYLDRLARLVEEWEAVAPAGDAPDAAAKLVDRLAEFRGGAARMEAAAHPTPDRDRLRSKFRDLGRELDKLIGLQRDISPRNLIPSVGQLAKDAAADLRAGRLER